MSDELNLNEMSFEELSDLVNAEDFNSRPMMERQAIKTAYKQAEITGAEEAADAEAEAEEDLADALTDADADGDEPVDVDVDELEPVETGDGEAGDGDGAVENKPMSYN